MELAVVVQKPSKLAKFLSKNNVPSQVICNIEREQKENKSSKTYVDKRMEEINAEIEEKKQKDLERQVFVTNWVNDKKEPCAFTNLDAIKAIEKHEGLELGTLHTKDFADQVAWTIRRTLDMVFIPIDPKTELCYICNKDTGEPVFECDAAIAETHHCTTCNVKISDADLKTDKNKHTEDPCVMYFEMCNRGFHLSCAGYKPNEITDDNIAPGEPGYVNVCCPEHKKEHYVPPEVHAARKKAEQRKLKDKIKAAKALDDMAEKKQALHDRFCLDAYERPREKKKTSGGSNAVVLFTGPMEPGTTKMMVPDPADAYEQLEIWTTPKKIYDKMQSNIGLEPNEFLLCHKDIVSSSLRGWHLKLMLMFHPDKRDKIDFLTTEEITAFCQKINEAVHKMNLRDDEILEKLAKLDEKRKRDLETMFKMRRKEMTKKYTVGGRETVVVNPKTDGESAAEGTEVKITKALTPFQKKKRIMDLLAKKIGKK